MIKIGLACICSSGRSAPVVGTWKIKKKKRKMDGEGGILRWRQGNTLKFKRINATSRTRQVAIAQVRGGRLTRKTQAARKGRQDQTKKKKEYGRNESRKNTGATSAPLSGDVNGDALPTLRVARLDTHLEDATSSRS